MIFYVKKGNPAVDPKMMMANSLVAIDSSTLQRKRLILSADNISHEVYTEFADFVSGCDSIVFFYSDTNNDTKELTLSDERGNASQLRILDGEQTIKEFDVAPPVKKKIKVTPVPTKKSHNLKSVSILNCCSFDKDDCMKLLKRSLIIGGIGVIIFTVVSLISNKHD